MSYARAAAAVVVLLSLAGEGRAQDGDHAPGCMALTGNVSSELMQRPIGLEPGTGKLHQQVSTKSKRAQAYYDQGIAYLASYDWADAARSFHEALRLDPELAMAHLGLAKAYENAEASDEARAQLDQAEGLAKDDGVTEKERVWIELGRQQFDAVHAPDAEQQELLVGYRAAVDRLVALDPSDAHAWVLRGNAEEPGAWGRGQAGGVGSIAYYEAALNRDPQHLGAHHFLAHSYENIGQPAAAADYARRYAADAPGVPHAQHMLGHVLPRLGKWKEARAQFTKANDLELAYYAREKIAPEEDWHHGHNLHLLGVINLQLGDDKQAELYLRQAYDLNERGVLAGTYGGPYVQFLLLRGRNDEALSAARGLEQRDSKAGRLVGAALAGEALINLGRIDEARAELERAEKLNGEVAAELANTRYARFLPAVSTQYLKTLRGRLLLRGDQPQDGEVILLELADEVGHNPRLDAWASGMLRVERALADAQQLHRPELAQQLRQRTKGLTPAS